MYVAKVRTFRVIGPRKTTAPGLETRSLRRGSGMNEEAKLKTLKQGIHGTVSASRYHADDLAEQPSLSASIAKTICLKSPWHAWHEHPRLNPDYGEAPDTKYDLGTIAHALLLEGMDVAEVLDYPDWRTKAAREARDEIRSGGRIPILQKDWITVKRMVAAAYDQLGRHRGDAGVFGYGSAERVLLWQEPDYGNIWCRARLDWLHADESTISDYKTRRGSANPEIISRTLFSEGWDIQAAFYLRGLEAVTGNQGEFRFVCQEVDPPHALSIVSLAPDALMLAQKKVAWALEKWQECLSSGQWPGYPTEICYATMPPWEEVRWLEKESEGVSV